MQREECSRDCVQVQLMAVIEDVRPKFITIEEVDGFLFHSVDLDRKVADNKKERVRKGHLLHKYPQLHVVNVF